MTIQGAINSSKKFKRPDDNFWAFIKDEYIIYKNDYTEVIYSPTFTTKDILATDWEVLICEEHNIIASDSETARVGSCAKCSNKERKPDYMEMQEKFDKIIEQESSSCSKCTCDINIIMGKGCQCGGA